MCDILKNMLKILLRATIVFNALHQLKNLKEIVLKIWYYLVNIGVLCLKIATWRGRMWTGPSFPKELLKVSNSLAVEHPGSRNN
jgi:hypothetical protein